MIPNSSGLPPSDGIEEVAPLMFAFNHLYPFRQQLLSMLRPIDIISLVMATNARLSRADKRRQLAWWRQILFDMRWVDRLQDERCTATIIGNGLRTLNTAITYGDFRLNLAKIKLIVVIGEMDKGHPASDQRNLSILQSFDTKVVWLPAATLLAGTFQQKNDLSTWVVSVIQDNVADLDQSLSDVLSRNEGPLGSFLTGHGRKYPYTCALWGTEWQQLARHKASYDPTRMLYMIHEDQFHEYWMRVFVNGAGVCCVDFMKRDEFILEQGL